MRTHLTRAEAEAFYEMPDRSRTKFLKTLTPSEREQILVSLALALRDPAELGLAA